MPLGHLELDTGVAWNSHDIQFSFRTRLHSATLEGNITKAGALVLGFQAWIDASGGLEDSVLSFDLSGPDAEARAQAIKWVPCLLPSNHSRDNQKQYQVAEQCRRATATKLAAGVEVFAYGA